MKEISYTKTLLILMLLLSGFVSCSTARNRSLIKPKNDVIKNLIIDKTRTANFYKDYRRVVIMDALYFDWELRKLFIENYTDSYYEDKKELLKQHQQEHNNLYSFFVFISFQKSRSELQNPDSHWKFFVKDNPEGEYYKTEVKKLKKKDIYSFFLEKNFYYYDNWTDLYLVTAVRSSEKPTEILKLQLGSLQGKAEAKWDSPTLFKKIKKKSSQ